MTTIVRGFGLTVSCEDGVSAPGLPAPESTQQPCALIRIGKGAVPSIPPDAHRVRELGTPSDPTLTVDLLVDGRYRIEVPEDGVFVVAADGDLAECWPRADAVLWPEMITMQVLPLMATLRGIEVFHAGVVDVDGGACVIAGPSEAGKSSTTAHLVAAGAPLITDDVAGIEVDGSGTPTVHSGSYTLRLFPHEAQVVQATAPDIWIDDGWSEGKRLLTSRRTSGVRPLRWFCLLEPDDTVNGVVIDQVSEAVPAALLGSTFNTTVRSPVRLTRQLDVCVAIGHHATVLRVRGGAGADARDVASALQARLHAG